MAVAEYVQDGEVVDYTPDAATLGGTIVQVRDGRAGVVCSDIAAGAKGSARVTGIVDVDKTASINLLDGGKVYWDHSASKAHFKPVADRDFYLGAAAEDAAATDTKVKVALNVWPAYIFDSRRDLVDSTPVGSTTPPSPARQQGGGTRIGPLGATSEAQKGDVISKRGFALGSNAIAEFEINVLVNGPTATTDLSIGIASGTHASNFDTIAECVSIHVDGDSANILAQSDDGSTAVAAADTTIDLTAGTPFELWIDTRNPADCKMYIDGVRVMDGTTGAAKTFILATGPFYWIAHLEKSTATDVSDVIVSGGVRLAQQ